MSYRCGKCEGVVPPNQPMRKITNFRTVRISLDSERTRREIASEVPVCYECLQKHTTETLADKFQTR
jgi:hypothetical protein